MIVRYCVWCHNTVQVKSIPCECPICCSNGLVSPEHYVDGQDDAIDLMAGDIYLSMVAKESVHI